MFHHRQRPDENRKPARCVYTIMMPLDMRCMDDWPMTPVRSSEFMICKHSQ